MPRLRPIIPDDQPDGFILNSQSVEPEFIEIMKCIYSNMEIEQKGPMIRFSEAKEYKFWTVD